MFQAEVQKMEAAAQFIQNFLPRIQKQPLVRKRFWLGLILTVILTPILALSFNFLTSHYSVLPEIHDFLAFKNAQIGIEANRQISQEVKREQQARLTALRTNASLAGVQISRAGETAKLNSYAGLLGVFANTVSGQKEVLPLVQTASYAKGIFVNMEIGSEYYHLPFRLDVTGSLNGVLASVQTVEFNEGLNLFTASLKLIQRTENFLQVNPKKYLDKSSDRELALRNYLTYLNNLENSLLLTQKKIASATASLGAKESSSQAKANTEEQQFFTALKEFDQNRTQKSLDDFIVNKQDNVDQKAQLQALTQIALYLEQDLPRVVALRQAVEANREALIQGIQVVAFEQIDLGLIK